MWKKGTFQVGPPKQSGKSRLNVAEHAGGGIEVTSVINLGGLRAQDWREFVFD